MKILLSVLPTLVQLIRPPGTDGFPQPQGQTGMAGTARPGLIASAPTARVRPYIFAVRAEETPSSAGGSSALSPVPPHVVHWERNRAAVHREQRLGIAVLAGSAGGVR
ncbi:hypothetical protein FZ103_10790 [Streptomonospora sp. PA3]|uniref:hypothetical protein n=1 Tax=Streptomonospora sp. PA3 TaxID=2607326 RepID=UPI0012DCF015|nr:hypothetical protein [Streptomonospora sp. PA3]MUL41652.1 hypothetical protein [Streptomonospora sp. PA3]